MDFSVTDEQKELQAKAREFAINDILPIVHYFDEHDEMPIYVVRRAHAAGLTNLSIPKQYGGQGFGLMESAIVVEEIAAACPALGTSIFGNTLGQEPLMMSENEVAKEKYLPLFVQDPKIVSFATSEPMMGSDVASMRCKATPDGDDYILNGTKYWITNAGFADYASVFATEDPSLKHKGIGAFFVDMKADGVTVGKPIPKLGQRLSNTAAIKFTDYHVPAEDVLAPTGKGFALAMKTFGRTRPIIGAFATGAARSCMEFAIDWAKKRMVFGAKLAEMQNTQFRIAEMYQKVETMRLLVQRAAWEADQGRDPTVAASVAKMYSTEAAQEVASTALQIFAGYGYTKFYPIEEILRDLRVLPIYEGTSEVQRIVVSRYAMDAYTPAMPPLEDLPSLTADDPVEAAQDGMPEQTVWRCRICGALYYGDEPPEECEYCRFPRSSFKKVWPKE